MKIQVAFTCEKKPDIISKIIMWVLKSTYSHVFLVHNESIYHSVGDGVCKIKLSDYLKTHNLIKYFDVELDCSEEVFEAFMAGEDGKDYSESQYIGFMFPFMQSYFDNDNEKRICSEFVAIVLEKYGKYVLPKDADFMHPKDVYLMLDRK